MELGNEVRRTMTQENILMGIWAFSFASIVSEEFGRNDSETVFRFTIIAVAAAIGWCWL